MLTVFYIVFAISVFLVPILIVTVWRRRPLRALIVAVSLSAISGLIALWVAGARWDYVLPVLPLLLFIWAPLLAAFQFIARVMFPVPTELEKDISDIFE